MPASNSSASTPHTIADRPLEFVLAIEAENPEADAVPSGVRPIQNERVTQIFNTTVMGGQTAIGSSGSFENVEKQVKVGDIDSLHEALIKLGIPQEQISKLDEILEEANPEEIRGPRGRIPEWVKSAGEAVRNTTVEVGTKIVSELIKSYAGVS
jgi:hypothetical protein